MSDPLKTAYFLGQSCPIRPRLAVILGSGFGGMADDLEVRFEASYADLDGFSAAAVAGHDGRLLIGELAGVPLLVLKGRVHYYEGHAMDRVVYPVQVLAEFGVTDLLLTNAAGAINEGFAPGQFMIVTDHINFMGVNPLRGINLGSDSGFVDLSDAYDPALRGALRESGVAAGVTVHEGVYLAVSGPSFETPAEIRAFRRLGADAVGMSTVPEVIMARRRGLRVAALSCLTNLAAGMGGKEIRHGDVLAAGERTRGTVSGWLKAFLERYRNSGQRGLQC